MKLSKNLLHKLFERENALKENGWYRHAPELKNKWLDDDGVLHSSPKDTIEFSFSGITAVSEGSDHCLIYTKDGTEHRLTPEEYDHRWISAWREACDANE